MIKNLLTLIKKLVKWTTLYNFHQANYFKVPEVILASLKKKTWFTSRSREFGFRFLLYMLYYSVSISIVIPFIGNRDSRQIIWILNGGVYMLDSLLIMIGKAFAMFLFMPKQEFEAKIKSPKSHIAPLFFGLFPIIWLISTAIYFMFYVPIFIVLMNSGRYFIDVIGSVSNGRMSFLLSAAFATVVASA